MFFLCRFWTGNLLSAGRQGHCCPFGRREFCGTATRAGPASARLATGRRSVSATPVPEAVRHSCRMEGSAWPGSAASLSKGLVIRLCLAPGAPACPGSPASMNERDLHRLVPIDPARPTERRSARFAKHRPAIRGNRLASPQAPARWRTRSRTAYRPCGNRPIKKPTARLFGEPGQSVAGPRRAMPGGGDHSCQECAIPEPP